MRLRHVQVARCWSSYSRIGSLYPPLDGPYPPLNSLYPPLGSGVCRPPYTAVCLRAACSLSYLPRLRWRVSSFLFRPVLACDGTFLLLVCDKASLLSRPFLARFSPAMERLFHRPLFSFAAGRHSLFFAPFLVCDEELLLSRPPWNVLSSSQRWSVSSFWPAIERFVFSFVIKCFVVLSHHRASRLLACDRTSLLSRPYFRLRRGVSFPFSPLSSLRWKAPPFSPAMARLVVLLAVEHFAFLPAMERLIFSPVMERLVVLARYRTFRLAPCDGTSRLGSEISPTLARVNPSKIISSF